MESEAPVKKDMGTDFNDKLSMILSEIDFIKKNLVPRPEAIIELNERTQAWYVKLYGKMIIQKLDADVKIEEDFIKQLLKIGSPVYILNRNDRGRLCEPYPSVSNVKLPGYAEIIRNRETHLNLVMEKLGLTNIQKKERKPR